MGLPQDTWLLEDRALYQVPVLSTLGDMSRAQHDVQPWGPLNWPQNGTMKFKTQAAAQKPCMLGQTKIGLFDLCHHCGQKCGQSVWLGVDRGLVK